MHRRTLPLIPRLLLTVAFLLAGITKFFPHLGWGARFAEWGLPGWSVVVIGALESLGVIGLWIPGLRRPATALLAIIMLGAMYTLLTHPPMVAAVRPLTILLVLGLLEWSERRTHAG